MMCHSNKQPAKLAMPTLIILLPLLLLCYGVGNIHCSTVHDNRIDRQALLDFKQGITGDPNEALSNWTLSSHFCHWNGVVCTTTRPWRVQLLLLNGSSLAGQISPSLGNLTSLRALDLSDNNFVGPLPPLLGRLKQLQYLILNNNNLSGPIPDELTDCSNLTYVDLSSNSLVGSISPKFGLLSNLYSVNFGTNQLNGSIPGELGRLSKLQYLQLNDNKLSGEIPLSFSSLSSLISLSLENNMLGKALPPNIGELLPSLTMLTMENNSFEGPIPASLGSALELEMIDLSLNNFSGQIPTSLGKLSNLRVLNLGQNHLVAKDNQDWEFMNALRNCKSLEFLSLTYNELQGSLPQSIGNLSASLQHLLLTGNSLSGEVPQDIGKFSSLIEIQLGENSFSGSIEGWIENLQSLQSLQLQSNNFTGPIPSFNNLTKLVNLDLSGNELEGSIPSSLGNCLGLQHLDLSRNNLQGYIPPSFDDLQGLLQLDLSHNNLQGNITHIGNLKKLSTLDLSSNQLSGPIPDSLGQCLDLVSVQMAQNFLTGSIPTTFGNLTFLSMLNLSHNNLSGSIPKSLSVLKSLIELDLSYNRLHGEVPINGVFENATAVSLEGNGWFCGGPKDLHMPSCTADSSKKTKLGYYLIRVLIPVFGFMSLALLVYFILLVTKMPRRYSSLTSYGENFLKVSYNDLAQATSNFSESNFIGRGSYGTVYRGELKESKMEVAVKVFDLEMSGGERSFLKECEVLRGIQHRNLLPVITACSTVDNTGRVFKALVYEFMSNGNLDKWLHHKADREAQKPLSLCQRLSIAVNIADVLDYLHHDCGRTTIHCDLKPSNILLDDDMNALLGDFSIASFYQDSSSTLTGTTSSIGVKGTIGYIAPEYAGGGRRAATSDDVYGFGIMLLEMMTGRRPTDPMFKDGVSIVNFVDGNFPHEICQVIDVHLTEECKNFAEAKAASENVVHQCLVSVLQLALSCTNPVPSERMNMKEIATRMHAIQTTYIAKGKTKHYDS